VQQKNKKVAGVLESRADRRDGQGLTRGEVKKKDRGSVADAITCPPHYFLCFDLLLWQGQRDGAFQVLSK
jgi:hypothetical protein